MGTVQSINVNCAVCGAVVDFLAKDGWKCCGRCGAGVYLKLKPVISHFDIVAEYYPKGNNDFRYGKPTNPELLEKFLKGNN